MGEINLHRKDLLEKAVHQKNPEGSLHLQSCQKELTGEWKYSLGWNCFEKAIQCILIDSVILVKHNNFDGRCNPLTFSC